MNVSTARIPHKSRSKGNARLRKDRVTARGYADTAEGIELARQGIASVKVTYADGSTETRSVNSFRKSAQRSAAPKVTAPQSQPDVLRFADTIGYIGDQNH